VTNPAPTPAAVGIGLKASQVPEILREGAPLEFFEVHAKNYMVPGGPYLRHLEQIRERFSLSIHGVGLSIDGVGPLDARHLGRLDALLRRFQPQWFSEHLAWSSHGGAFYNDLLPVPYDQASLTRVCDHVDQVQDRLGRTLLLENPSTYIEFTASCFDEGTFLAEVVRRTGCGLLLDLNNAYVSAVNHGRDPFGSLRRCPAGPGPSCPGGDFHLERIGPGDALRRLPQQRRRVPHRGLGRHLPGHP